MGTTKAQHLHGHIETARDALASLGQTGPERQVANADQIQRISLRVWPVGGNGPPADLTLEEIAIYRAYIVQGRMQGWMSEMMASRALGAAMHSENMVRHRLSKARP